MSDDDEARRFAVEHAHYDEDIAFWRRHAARLGGPVLDLGCATGRVAIPLARDGHEVWALDRAPAMLDELRRRLAREDPAVAARVHPVEGDLARFDLGRRFGLVAVAMNTLQVLTDPADRVAAFRSVRDHLAPGGELIFDVALPDLEEIRDSMGRERPGGRYRDPATGEVLTHSAWYDSWDPGTQTLAFTLRIRARNDGGPGREALRRHRVHLFTPQELEGLLQDAGLRHLEASGGFDGRPLREDGERQVHRAGVAA
ncbi:MAG TPA: class I SAM-dependent methyltransferase [Miltoncostaeaceae bacterium]|nr:class I SAM-dependent methyltransferase [Miltoncostaeaceae bacterium]